jgi:RNA polymerase primary sigma factor
LRCKPLGELLHWLESVSAEKRLEIVHRAEQLHDSIEPGATYPFEYLAYRLTGFRRDWGDDSLLVGEAVAEDLRAMIDRLSRSVDLPAGDEDAMPADLWALRLDISTKTLSRWRKLGLRWRWIVPEHGGRKVVGYTASAIERFRQRHADRLDAAMRFSQLDDKMRAALVKQARKIVAENPKWSLNQVAQRLADLTGRALETMRGLLKRHDEQHPDSPMFPRQQPMSRRELRQLAHKYKEGTSIAELARRTGRNAAALRRMLRHRQVAIAHRLRLNYHEAALFERPDAEAFLLERGAESKLGEQPLSSVPTEGLPDDVALLYRQPVLSADTVRRLFLRFNFLKRCAAMNRKGWGKELPGARALSEFERDVARAGRTKHLLTRLHLPTVLSVARRHLLNVEDPGNRRLLMMLEAGNATLAGEIDAYDPVKRPTFDSVLTNRLLQRYATLADEPIKAVRRVTPKALAKKLIEAANESGVYLLEDLKSDAPNEPRP